MRDIRPPKPLQRGTRSARAVVVVSLLAGALSRSAAAADATAADRIAAMAEVLAKAKALSVEAECSYEAMQESGQKIEFGERRVMTLRRPDRARVDVTRRDGSRRGVVFDGTNLTAFDLDEKIYATASRPGTVDAAFVHFTRDLGMRLPLRELFAADLPATLKPFLATARVVGEEKLAAVATDHVAFRGDTVDVELWIPRDGDPLPRRIVITYRLAEGQPRFAADLAGWNLAPDVPDSLFVFTPSSGAERIPILAPRTTPPEGAKSR